jgi:hypothetical protein
VVRLDRRGTERRRPTRSRPSRASPARGSLISPSRATPLEDADELLADRLALSAPGRDARRAARGTAPRRDVHERHVEVASKVSTTCAASSLRRGRGRRRRRRAGRRPPCARAAPPTAESTPPDNAQSTRSEPRPRAGSARPAPRSPPRLSTIGRRVAHRVEEVHSVPPVPFGVVLHHLREELARRRARAPGSSTAAIAAAGEPAGHARGRTAEPCTESTGGSIPARHARRRGPANNCALGHSARPRSCRIETPVRSTSAADSPCAISCMP